ncbi:retrovirus-related pol polyprotein from transposon TNT 1-94 [Tanacetum coccineum]
MDIPAISCPSCNANVESANHVFFECDIATDMWKLVFRWCDIPLFQASSWDSFNDWIISWHASKEKKHRFYVITTSVLWWLWRYRNSVTFNSQPLRKSDLFDNVRFSSFSWLHNRDHMKLSWNDWLMYPLSITRNGNVGKGQSRIVHVKLEQGGLAAPLLVRDMKTKLGGFTYVKEVVKNKVSYWVGKGSTAIPDGATNGLLISGVSVDPMSYLQDCQPESKRKTHDSLRRKSFNEDHELHKTVMSSIDLVHSYEGPSDTKENRIMDLKQYNTFIAKDSESLSQTITYYKTLLNEMINDGVTLSKLEINVAKESKDYKAEYKRVRAKLALLNVDPSNTQPTKYFQSKNKGLVSETYDLDKEEVNSDDEQMVEVKVLMAFADEEQLIVGKNHANNDEWVNITIRNVNILLSMDEDADWQSYLIYINVDHNQAINESLGLTETPTDPESSKDSESKHQTPLPRLKILQGASPSLESSLNTSGLEQSTQLAIIKRDQSLSRDMIKILHVFGSPMFIHNHKDHLGKFDAKADDGYFLGYSLISKAFRVFNTMTQQSEETFNVTFDEIETPNIDDHLWEKSKPLVSHTKALVPDVIHTSITHQATSSSNSYHAPQNRWSKEQHIELVNIIGKPTKGMLIKSIASKLTAGSASKCLFANFLSHIEPKTVSKALKEHGLESIRIFLAYATYMNLNVLQMDVKSIVMNGKLKEEVYVQQPSSLESRFDLKGYSNSDYAGCSMDRKSTSGACQMLSQNLVCWSAKKQQSVAMSSVKAKYDAAVRCCANILWMKSQLSDYDMQYKMVPIFCDNTNAISIFNDHVIHLRTKYIDIRYHFIKDHIIKCDIELHFIPTTYELVDICTKPLDEPTYTILKAELGMLNID